MEVGTGTAVRAVTFQIIEPLSGSWKELRESLAEMWRETTRASNWMMRELYLRDVRRDGQAKMPPMPRVYLYPEARALFPGLPPQTVASLERAVSRKYRALRYQIVWTCGVSLPTFRYPVPFPIHNQSWSCEFDAGNRPVVDVRLPRGEEKRWELRLIGGPRYRRQLAAFRQMVEGTVTRGEMALWKNHDGELLCKMVGRFPLRSPKELSGVLRVRTDRERLLIALDDKDERIWNLNADHVRRWIAEYADTLERLRQDRKAEQRPHPSFEARQSELVAKQRRRMDSAVKEAASQVCRFALRRKFSAVHYTDNELGFAASFPWFQLRQRIATKCEDLGLMFEHASAGVEEKSPDALGEGEVQ